MELYDVLAKRYHMQDVSETETKSELEVATVRRVVLETGIAVTASFFLEIFAKIIFSYIALFFLNVLNLRDNVLGFSIINHIYGTAVSYLPKLLAFGILYRRLRPLYKLNTKYQTKLYLLPILFFALFTFGMWGTNVTDLVNSFLQLFFGAGEVPDIMQAAAPSDFSEGIVTLISSAIAAPIMEELIYRRLLMTPLRAVGDVPAVVISALIFGLMHGNFDQFCYSFFGGIIFGLTAIRYGSIKYSILLHALHNLIVTMLEYANVLAAGGAVWEFFSGFVIRLGEFTVFLSRYGGPLIVVLLVLTGVARLDRVEGSDKYKKLRTVFCPALIVGMALELASFA